MTSWQDLGMSDISNYIQYIMYTNTNRYVMIYILIYCANTAKFVYGTIF